MTAAAKDRATAPGPEVPRSFQAWTGICVCLCLSTPPLILQMKREMRLQKVRPTLTASRLTSVSVLQTSASQPILSLRVWPLGQAASMCFWTLLTGFTLCVLWNPGVITPSPITKGYVRTKWVEHIRREPGRDWVLTAIYLTTSAMVWTA